MSGAELAPIPISKFADLSHFDYASYRTGKSSTMKQTFVKRILGVSRTNKRLLALAVDVVLCVATVLVAYYLRTGTWVVPVGTQWLSVAASLLFALPLFVTFGLYRAIFRYAGWHALGAVARAGVVYGMLYSSVFTVIGVSGVPRTIGIIQPILLFLAVGASRAFARFWLGGGYEALRNASKSPRVVIYGAGSAGRQLAAALANSQEMQVVGFIDDDVTLQGSILNGNRIYPPVDLDALFHRLGVSDVLLAVPSVSRKRRNEILDIVRATSAGVRTLPGMMDLAHGRVTVSDLRELDIEDLLGRDAVAPNQILMGKNISGKTVMVTGAGGSIGSELCRQIAQLNPDALILVEMSEVALYTVHQELELRLVTEVETPVRLVPILASVCDDRLMRSVMATWRPDTVYHAAAYKHVPLVEQNPAEGVRNNVFGTRTTAQLAQEFGVHDFVLISTDKAVRPTSVMGTSKRLAEMVLQALAARKGGTRFSMVRFGNVLGSSGSVVPLFRRQIRNGGPVTITHEDITRYFMTIPEAAQLVIQAGAMAVGGEVFVLDMGAPVKIIDLARKMINLSGFSVRDAANPDGDIEVVTVGLRPGEKLYEELLIGENPLTTNHARIMKAEEPFLPLARLESELAQLDAEIYTADPAKVLTRLKKLVPEFAPELAAGSVPDPERLAR
jgi:FlaA1/EpsC-like NDP-sugar epimerase